MLYSRADSGLISSHHHSPSGSTGVFLALQTCSKCVLGVLASSPPGKTSVTLLRLVWSSLLIWSSAHHLEKPDTYLRLLHFYDFSFCVESPQYTHTHDYDSLRKDTKQIWQREKMNRQSLGETRLKLSEGTLKGVIQIVLHSPNNELLQDVECCVPG